MKKKGQSLVTAESCTGGWVAQAVTSIAGSSEWFERGYVTYSNASKREALGVTRKTLLRYGAVSEPTAPDRKYDCPRERVAFETWEARTCERRMICRRAWCRLVEDDPTLDAGCKPRSRIQTGGWTIRSFHRDRFLPPACHTVAAVASLFQPQDLNTAVLSEVVIESEGSSDVTGLEYCE